MTAGVGTGTRRAPPIRQPYFRRAGRERHTTRLVRQALNIASTIQRTDKPLACALRLHQKQGRGATHGPSPDRSARPAQARVLMRVGRQRRPLLARAWLPRIAGSSAWHLVRSRAYFKSRVPGAACQECGRALACSRLLFRCDLCGGRRLRGWGSACAHSRRQARAARYCAGGLR